MQSVFHVSLGRSHSIDYVWKSVLVKVSQFMKFVNCVFHRLKCFYSVKVKFFMFHSELIALTTVPCTILIAGDSNPLYALFKLMWISSSTSIYWGLHRNFYQNSNDVQFWSSSAANSHRFSCLRQHNKCYGKVNKINLGLLSLFASYPLLVIVVRDFEQVMKNHEEFSTFLAVPQCLLDSAAECETMISLCFPFVFNGYIF